MMSLQRTFLGLNKKKCVKYEISEETAVAWILAKFNHPFPERNTGACKSTVKLRGIE